MKPTEPRHLFVYGTLKQDSHHPMSRVLRRHARRVGPGVFRGQLYRVGWYPGAKDSPRLTDRVFGELYVLEHPAPCLEALDAYEGSEFVRVARDIRRGRRRYTAWIYLYEPPIERLARIPDGRFVTTRRTAHTR
jgi:gamma-glutamylcyclotransferase (GGCT)/AIG2-like uncharacterized protein YtfP